MVPRRYAGYRLAGLPLENVNAKVSEAADVLKANATPLPTYKENIPVPNYKNANVSMGAHRSSISLSNNKTVLGNAEEIQKMINAKPPGVLTLGWNVNNTSELDDKGRFAAARIAQKEFKRIFNDIPDGTIVKNSPIGGTSGDYTRADAYMTQGMGPLQSDGQQYGIMKNGQMEPLSPFIPMTEHAHHLADRAERGGQQEIADFIRLELGRRYKKDNPLPKRIRKAGQNLKAKLKGQNTVNSQQQMRDEYDDQMDYDEPYYDDDDYTERNYYSNIKPETTRVRDRDRAITRNISAPVRDSGPEVDFNTRNRIAGDPIYVPEIQLRNYNKDQIRRDMSRYSPGNEQVNTTLEPGSTSEALYSAAYPNVYIPTAQDINQVRQLQSELAMIPGGARRALDQIEAVRPRAAPPTLTIGDNGTIYGDRPFGRARSEYNVPTLDSWDSDIVRPSPNFVPNDTQMRDVARADVARGYTDTRPMDEYNFRDPNDVRRASTTYLQNSPEMINEMRQYQTILNPVQQRSDYALQDQNARVSSNPDIIALDRSGNTNTDLVSAIRGELGLRRNYNSLIPDTDDIPF